MLYILDIILIFAAYFFELPNRRQKMLMNYSKYKKMQKNRIDFWN